MPSSSPWYQRWWRRRTYDAAVGASALPPPISEPLSTEPPSSVPVADYHPDAAVEDPAADRFRRWPFAQRIAHTIIARTDPSSLVIGIYGAWGEGKTTVLNFVKHNLDRADRVICFRFNPWRFPNEDALLRSFFARLASEVRTPSRSMKQRVGGGISALGAAIPKVTIKSPGADASGDGPSAEIDLGGMIRDFGDNLSSSSLDEEKERISGILRRTGTRVVILMDDLDRLDNQEIHAVFRLVKLSADFANTVYVLAFDPEMVARALGERYSTSSGEAGLAFLEKIVQVPLRLPAADRVALREYAFEGVDRALAAADIELSKEQVQEYVTAFHRGLEPSLRTPRMANRYANLLSFSLPILKGEVNPVDMMLVEGMRVFYPKLYDTVRVNKEVFTGADGPSFTQKDEPSNKRVEAAVESGTRALTAEERAAATALLDALFPRAMGLLRNIHYGLGPVAWAQEQRVTTDEYFDRYFSYAVPKGDIPDRVIRDVISTAAEASPAVLALRILSAVGKDGADVFLTKLLRQEDLIDAESAQALSLALAQLGGTLSDAGLLGFTPRRRAALIAIRLLGRIEDPVGRMKVAREILSSASPFDFAVECYRSMLPTANGSTPESVGAFAEEETVQLREQLSIQARDTLVASPDLLLQDQGSLLVRAWAESAADEARAWVETRLAEDPCVADTLVYQFAVKWKPLGGGPLRPEFTRNSYDELSKVVDVDLLVKKLGISLDEASEGTTSREFTEGSTEALIQQFARIHRYVTTQESA